MALPALTRLTAALLATCAVPSIGVAATGVYPGRVAELSAQTGAPIDATIREPVAQPPAIREPISVAAAAPRQYSFAPLEMAPPAPPIVEPPPPPLTRQPPFGLDREESSPAGARFVPQRSLPVVEAHPALPPRFSPVPSADVVLPTAPTTAWLPPSAEKNPPALAFQEAESMRAVAHRAAQISERAMTMAQRGMVYAAQAELFKALELIAQSLDVQQATSVHASSLASGLVALREARDFAPSAIPTGTLNVGQIAATHLTSLLQSDPAATTMSPVVAQQKYFGLAQEQLALAAEGQPIASQILYRIGKIHTVLAAHDDQPQSLHAPQAIVFYQAALRVDGRNYLAANELGVLLVRYGQLADARRLFLHSVSIHPQVVSWKNLAQAHRLLGEEGLAQRAENEAEMLAKSSGAMAGKATDLVRWVDPATFAKSGDHEGPLPAASAARATSPASSAARR